MVVAAQNNDSAALAGLAPMLVADSKAVNSSFDVQALNAFEHQQLDPYRQRYETEMKKAGFQVTTSQT